MKFTSKDLMNAMGLKKGDTIRIAATGLLFSEDIVCKVCSDNNAAWLETKDSKISLDSLIGMEFEVVSDSIGHTVCKDWHCHKCPLRMLTGCESVNPDMTLYQCLEYIKDDIGELFDQEIYDLIKARLDKH